MKLHNATAKIFVPDGNPCIKALRRVTHLGIGAHQDDLEFMAFHGIMECFTSGDKWFGGVTCSDGSGCSRTGPYATHTDAEMTDARCTEQNTAAVIGRYSAMIQLDYPGRVIKSAMAAALKVDLKQILDIADAEVVYTHNLADKHDTHVAVGMAALQAMREMPRERRPRQIIGCEVWRSLDWLPDDDKVLMDVSGRDNLAFALNGVFDSQITGGKRYDLATFGRRTANATFLEAHAADHSTQLIFGMDLTPLVTDESLDIAAYVCAYIDKFKADVERKINQWRGKL